MEIEKVMTVAAPAAQVWTMLLDPNVMGSCVPGMKSIEVLSDVEYIALMHVKISFISAKFKLRTTIVEQQAPHYLRCEGTGEDASVASSLKQQSELFLAVLPDGGTEIRMKVKVDVLGRLGTFGLSVMKTKADRMWDEFGQNLVARLDGGPPPLTTGKPAPTTTVATASTAPTTPPVAAVATAAPAPAPAPASSARPTGGSAAAPAGWWTRLWRGQPAASAGGLDGEHIRVEIRRGDTQVCVHWPRQDAQGCTDWLREFLQPCAPA